MKQTSRWFWPKGSISIDDLLQLCGVEAFVKALHDLPPGAVWSLTNVQEHIFQIAVSTEAHDQPALDNTSNPFRHNQGPSILNDKSRQAQPGYPAIGWLRGLAELRGVTAVLQHPDHGVV